MHSVGRLAARSGTLTDGIDCKQIAESVARSVCGLVRTMTVLSAIGPPMRNGAGSRLSTVR
jgi:hypothetical protein